MKWIQRYEQARKAFRVRTKREAFSARNSLKSKGHAVSLKKCKGYYELRKG
jgi:hypothetical protein